MGRNGLQEGMTVRVSKEWRAGASLGGPQDEGVGSAAVGRGVSMGF